MNQQIAGKNDTTDLLYRLLENMNLRITDKHETKDLRTDYWWTWNYKPDINVLFYLRVWESLQLGMKLSNTVLRQQAEKV